MYKSLLSIVIEIIPLFLYIYIYIYIYTTSQKFLNNNIFDVFNNSLLLTKPAFLIQNTANAVIVKYFYYLKQLLSIWIYF